MVNTTSCFFAVGTKQMLVFGDRRINFFGYLSKWRGSDLCCWPPVWGVIRITLGGNPSDGLMKPSILLRGIVRVTSRTNPGAPLQSATNSNFGVRDKRGTRREQQVVNPAIPGLPKLQLDVNRYLVDTGTIELQLGVCQNGPLKQLASF